jgi:hypothetical protein
MPDMLVINAEFRLREILRPNVLCLRVAPLRLPAITSTNAFSTCSKNWTVFTLFFRPCSTVLINCIFLIARYHLWRMFAEFLLLFTCAFAAAISSYDGGCISHGLSSVSGDRIRACFDELSGEPGIFRFEEYFGELDNLKEAALLNVLGVLGKEDTPDTFLSFVSIVPISFLSCVLFFSCFAFAEISRDPFTACALLLPLTVPSNSGTGLPKGEGLAHVVPKLSRLIFMNAGSKSTLSSSFPLLNERPILDLLK